MRAASADLVPLLLVLAALQACAARPPADDGGGIVPLTLEQQWEIEAEARRQSG